MKTIPYLLAAALALAAAAARADGDPDAPRTLHFARGHSSITVHGALLRGHTQVWRFGARAGQQASVALHALEHNAVFTVWCPGATLPASADDPITGRQLPGAGDDDDATSWSGLLPDSGDYLIEIAGTRGNASYTLTLKIAP